MENISQILESPITWIIIAALSEIVALSPLKSNSLVQLLFKAAYSIKPKKLSWPPDGEVVELFNTRSPLDPIHRWIRAQKFNTNLRARLDAEISKVAGFLDRENHG